MIKEKLKYEDFLTEVSLTRPEAVQGVNKVNKLLTENNCTVKLELAKNGYVVSYNFGKSVILNFVFRKNFLIARIYGDYSHNYQDVIEKLPDGMVELIEKAPLCKRLIDPAKCNIKCKMGYDFNLKGVHHQKCRYNGFMFPVIDENADSIIKLLENEINQRRAANI